MIIKCPVCKEQLNYCDRQKVLYCGMCWKDVYQLELISVEREPIACGCITEYSPVQFDSSGRSYGGEPINICQRCNGSGYY